MHSVVYGGVYLDHRKEGLVAPRFDPIPSSDAF
jgi:hypothetical protein